MPYIGLKLSLEAFESLRKCSKERNISTLYSEPSHQFSKGRSYPRIPGSNPCAPRPVCCSFGVPNKDRSKFLSKDCKICSNLKGENSNSTLFESELEVRTLEEQINMIPALRIVFCITYEA